MSRHIDIELTSHTPDGSWTWRAVGARQPRGTLDADAVPADTSVGATFRAEVESTIEGIEVIELSPPKADRTSTRVQGRIEIIGTPRRGSDISVTLAPGSKRRRDDDRPPRRDGERLPRRDGDRPPGRDGGRAPSGRGPGDGRRGAESPGGRGRPDRPDTFGGGPSRGRPSSSDRSEGAGPRRDRERRPTVSTAHRNAALAGLRPEQLPVAEAILRGGIPAVRQSIDEQNAAARAGGKPAAAADAILRMADELLPIVKLAEWKDRATSAQSAGRDLRLRELRAVVAGSRTVILDDEGRALAKALQESLDQRVTALRDEWLSRITTALDEGRTLDALRVTGRAPEPGTRCPADVAVRLAAAAGEAMTSAIPADEWLALLDAVVDSPVRRTVKPQGIPPVDEVGAAALNAAGLVPELAKLLGLRIPPPPPRRTVVRRAINPEPSGTRSGGGDRSGGGGRATGS